jgi:uncharacterized protein (DUF2236 family)
VDTSEPPADLAPLVAAVEDQVEGFFGSYLPGPALPTVLRPVRAFFGAATMPPAARDALGLEWRRRHEAAFRLFRAAVRPTYRALPARIRFKDAYLEAMGRVAADSDTRATRPTAATPDD